MVLASALLGTAVAAYHGYNAYNNFRRGLDYQKMARDYERNTGRKIKYDRARGYNNDARNAYANAFWSGVSGASTGYGLGKTFRDFFKEE